MMTTSALLRSSPRYLLALQSSRMASAPLSTASARMMAQSSTTSSEKGYIHPVYFELKEKQKAYQIDNGLRIHQRHGPLHRSLWYVTCVLIAVGTIDLALFLKEKLF